MKNIFYSLLLIVAVSCAGNSNEQASGSAPEEEVINEQAMEVVQETEATKAKAEAANQKADSILNSL